MTRVPLTDSIPTPIKTVVYTLVMMLAVFLQGCSGTPVASGGPIKGQILEWGSERPIVGATVVALWEGYIPSWGHGSSVCYHLLSTVTDNQGYYNFPAWKKKVPQSQKYIENQRVSVSSHKAGYRWPDKYRDKPGVNYVLSDNGTREQRLQYLMRVADATGCWDKSYINILPLYRALVDEARSIVKTDKDKDVLEILLFGLEDLEFGSDYARKKLIERRKTKQ